jgi:methionyl aminopeptidase
MEDKLQSLRKAAEIHKKVRNLVKDDIKPGAKVIDICEKIEHNVRELTKFNKEEPLKGGIGFPCGFSINDCAAHWTPTSRNESRIINKNDVCKIDFGVHIDGHIIDSAWTVSFNEKYDNLLNASKDATNTGLSLAGCDVRINEISVAIEEVINSYEIELNNKRYQIKPVRSLCGHQIDKYKIHSKKAIPIINIPHYNEKMKEGEVYAIETFATTGCGETVERGDCSHFMIDYLNQKPKRFQGLMDHQKKFLKQVYKNRATLPFCQRWSNSWDDLEKQKVEYILKDLVDRNIVNAYPPLYDKKGGFVSQFEHTIMIHKDKVDILSRGDDY